MADGIREPIKRLPDEPAFEPKVGGVGPPWPASAGATCKSQTGWNCRLPSPEGNLEVASRLPLRLKQPTQRPGAAYTHRQA